MKELVVPSKFNNKKLQSFLMHNFPSLTNSLFYKTLRKKDIKINNIMKKKNKIKKIILKKIKREKKNKKKKKNKNNFLKKKKK